MVKDFISIADLSKEEMEEIFTVAAELKERLSRGVSHRVLDGQTIALIFEKPSLRTRVTFEVGMFQLGGNSIYLTPEHIQLGVRESVADTARNLERWVDGVVARTFAHDTVTELAQNSRKPVINALTDKLHPCQIMADLLTVKEKLGRVEDFTLAFVGDGNNVANSWINAAARLAFSLRIATPPGYEPNQDLLDQVTLAAGDRVTLTHDAVQAVGEADVVYTDVWASMGQEDEAQERRKLFEDFQVNSKLMRSAKPDALVMHCLPAHRDEEITSEVLDGPNSAVYDQAENRLHVQKAILIALMRKKEQKRQRPPIMTLGGQNV
jgi:ornithine carbamoyltransferase